ncbi:hypothetical protein EFL77_09215 [Pediococcus pentosaceus]|uniref:hypothetical protein n=1 Tax=Pediococcus pentosaceus TaxID=1255 RepID=UPI00223B11B4|nr:hypothetical protein [Pediococcus pentosaceus]MCT1178674.1 hypothetical protein [Pediococcus pentosaceus]
MKLVRISDDTILDIDDVQFAIWDDNDQKVKIEFKSTNTYLYTKDKKVLDAICGSEEHSNGKDILIKAVVDELSEITDITNISVEYNCRNHEQPGGFQVHRR